MFLKATESAIDAAVLKRIRDAALKTTAAHAVYLFGSRARGDHHPDSDYDVLVVTWETDRTREIQRVVADAVRELDALADVKVVDPPTFLWRTRFANTVERAAHHEGVVLFMLERAAELREAASEWFRRGDTDLDFALGSVEDERFSAPVCFHAQQCVEKYLKGYLTYRETDVGRTHSLSSLLEPCIALERAFASWKQPLVPFERYAVEARYPGGYEPTRDDARSACEIARQLRDFVLALVEP
jgi:HEPN domain-containing protein/predicted nucleotidyltransferase